MLLARLYLNAEAWIGTPMYNECENLCNEIIATNKYRLDGDYSLPFSTNNELSNETMFVIPFDETKSGGQIYMWARKTLHYSQMQTFNLQATWLDGGCVGVPTFFDNYIEGDKRLEKHGAWDNNMHLMVLHYGQMVGAETHKCCSVIPKMLLILVEMLPCIKGIVWQI